MASHDSSCLDLKAHYIQLLAIEMNTNNLEITATSVIPLKIMVLKSTNAISILNYRKRHNYWILFPYEHVSKMCTHTPVYGQLASLKYLFSQIHLLCCLPDTPNLHTASHQLHLQITPLVCCTQMHTNNTCVQYKHNSRGR